MNDPYKEVFESISNTIKEHADMIVWLAERTLSVKEFKELIDKFGNKKDAFKKRSRCIFDREKYKGKISRNI